jgi:tRNA 2-thiocytidine biosynthesis protein TtcA
MSFDCPIASPPWNGSGKRLESRIRKAIYDFNLLENASKIAIALSGGKDSLTLLFMLKAISGRGFAPLDIVAIHVDGEFTCGAGVGQSFIRAICQKLEVPLIVKHSARTLEELECYSCSRERRSLLFKAAKEEGCQLIAFGHHEDDNVQTILMNLFHKGEFAGTLPKIKMLEYDITIIRPLIYVSEQEIKQFAEAHGFQRITCQCPVGQNSKRKQTEKLLQEIESLFPNARTNIAQAGLLYGSDKATRPKKFMESILKVLQ